MKIVIVGGGLIGVTSAYFLNRRGHEVVVLDRQKGPGRETSFANGALLTPSMPQPWNAPGCWRALLASLVRSDSPLQLRWRALPSTVGWGIQFLANSRRECFERNTLHNLRLALYSLGVMESLRQETTIEYGRSSRGSLRIFRNPESFQRALLSSEALAAQGLPLRRLTSQETVELEPSLVPIGQQLAGAIHFPKDETGDAYRFCIAMTDLARDAGVTFRFDTVVSNVEVRAGRVAALTTTAGAIGADCYVLACGSYSPLLLKGMGVRLPVRPAKGYSITFRQPVTDPQLRIPIVDDDFHAAVVPLGDGIRVAGTAEFAGYDLTLRPERVQYLLTLLEHVLPNAKTASITPTPWCGLRPMAADGVPIISAMPLSNLFVNTGHGPLGWTLTAGSAQILADLIDGYPTALDSAPYSIMRFSVRG
jgi:D-amino-acid dehydrogenase